jgi:hypothetical protein
VLAEREDIAIPNSKSAAGDHCNPSFEIFWMNLFRSDDLVEN